MFSFAVLWLGLTAIVFVFGYWAYDRETRQDRKIQECQGLLKVAEEDSIKIKNRHKTLDDYIRTVVMPGFADLCEKFDQANKKVKGQLDRIDELQQHCARLRDDQFLLQNQLSNKRPIVQLPTGVIQVEVIPGGKKLGDHKQQYEPKRNLGKSKEKKDGVLRKAR